MHNCVKSLTAVIFLAAYTLSLVAQSDASSTFENYELENLATLSNSSFWGNRGIIKDEIGRYWVSSMFGINLYDGYEMSYLFAEGNDKGRSIPSNAITSSVLDPSGNIWFGTGNEGLIKYNFVEELYEKIDLKNLKPDGSDITQINGIACDSEGKIWLAPPFRGAFVFNPFDSSFVKIKFDLPEGKKPLNFYGIIKLKDNNMAILSGNYLFIGNLKMGFESIPLPRKMINTHYFAELPNNEIIFYGPQNQGIRTYNRSTQHFREVNSTLRLDGFVISPKDKIYLSDFNNLYQYDMSIGKINRVSNRIGDINESMVDNYGDFICTKSDQLTRLSFKKESFNKLFDGSIRNLRMESDSTFYFTSKASIYLYNINSKRYKKIVDLSDHGRQLYNFKFLKNGNLFVNLFSGTRSSEYTILLSPSYEVISKIGYSRLYNSIECVDEEIFVNVEPFRFDSADKSDFHPSYIMDLIDSLKHQEEKSFFTMKYIKKLKNGEIWVAKFGGGIDVLSSRLDSVYSIGESDSAGLIGAIVRDIFESSSGQIYLVGNKGLNIYDPLNKTFRFLNKENGLKDYRILKIGEDKDGNIWILTKEKIYKYAYAQNELTKFDLPSFDFIDEERVSNLIIDTDNNFYLATYSGLYTFTQADFSLDPNQFNLAVTDLFLKRKRVFPKDDSGILDSTIIRQNELSLSYDKRDIGFKFIASDGAKAEIEYFYRLVGSHDEFIQSDISRTVHYTNLKPGSYSFEVKAKAGNGKWLDKTIKKKFTIHPPWYMTMVAYLIYVLLFFTILYLIYLNKVRQLTKYEMLRSKISRDLHDDVGTLLTSVAMQSEVLGINANEEESKKFEKLSNLSREAMARMRDTVWAIDSRKDNLKSLISRMEDYIEDLNVSNKFQITFSQGVSNEGSKLPPDIRRNTYLVFKEALGNAFKYSNGDKIKIQLKLNRKNLLLKVHDNGLVDPNKIKKSGLGLTNMHDRSDAINGDLNIDYTDGFLISLKVPL